MRRDQRLDLIMEYAKVNPPGWDRFHIMNLLKVGYERSAILLDSLVVRGLLQAERCDRQGKRMVYALPGVALVGTEGDHI